MIFRKFFLKARNWIIARYKKLQLVFNSYIRVESI